MKKDISFLNPSVIFILLICLSFNTLNAAVSDITIISPSGPAPTQNLAAKEIRRYLYLRTGTLFTILQTNNRPPVKNSLIIVGQKDSPVIMSMTARNLQLSSIINSLQPQQYLLKTISLRRGQAVLVVGADSIGTLYAAYRFAEHLGVRFYMHGDTIPDKQIDLKIPKLNEKGKPLFNLRVSSRSTIFQKDLTGGI
jgi:alpha-glucuronidase